MKKKMGKGETAAFDNTVSGLIEPTRKELGYYPSIRELTDRVPGNKSINVVAASLLRLAKDKRFSDEAAKIYGKKKQ